MPKVRRRGVPRALLEHLWQRIEEREISITDLELFATWLEREPDVPNAKWFKRFSAMTVCGEGEWVKTFLRAGQIPEGEEIVCSEALRRKPSQRSSGIPNRCEAAARRIGTAVQHTCHPRSRTILGP